MFTSSRRMVLRDITVYVYFITAVGMMATGLILLAGGDQAVSSPSYAVLKRIMSIQSWGWLFTLTGLGKFLLGFWGSRNFTRRLGSAIGGTVSLMWAGGFIGAAITGELIGGTAITAWLMIAGVQLAGAVSTVWRLPRH